ncbi:nucleoside monophosphate kinase [Candidatus Babeliales bacterium]|nr:nucleoside monophosphate kinase [Candidatus Babeliales bacterium]
MQQVTRFFSLCGPPGSGKGTLAARCEKELGATFLSVGDLCRKHIAQEDDLGKVFIQYTSKGKLVPDELIVKIVHQWLESNIEKEELILLDGYPRTVFQANALNVFFKKYKQVTFEVVFLNVLDDIIIERISSRLVCSDKNCQAVYSTLAKPSKKVGFCDQCNAPLIRRKDDDPMVVRKRIEDYNDIKSALLERYKSLDLALKALDATYLTRDQVFNWFIGCCIKEEKEVAL